jgi:hypothetical protein
MNIIEALQDDHLFRPFLGDLSTWAPWKAALRALYGLERPFPQIGERIAQCTGRDPAKLPSDGFQAALFLTGRRSGKSRISAVIGAYEAVLAGHEAKLAPGEQGLVAVCAPSRRQSRIVANYLRAVFDTPLLRSEVAKEYSDAFELKNGNRIEILTGDYRLIRGFTLIAAIVDEIAFFGLDEESKVKSDTELVRAIKPALATTGGKLICISSPYAKKGWTWNQFQRNYGNDSGRTLVWKAPSRYMNPTLPESVVQEAMEEDRAAALSEFFAEFRDDVVAYLPREVIERVVVPGRAEIPPRRNVRYTAFADLSGGRGDDAALAIAHLEERTVVVDLLVRYQPPFNPNEVVRQMVNHCNRYGIERVIGDNYAAEWVASAFTNNGIHYAKAEMNKSQLYLELLPRICAGEIELLDDSKLIGQLANLERRTRSGGKDSIDHPAGGHDDLANAVAGVAVTSTANRKLARAFLF